jgi:hypothetical protein
MSTVEDKTKPNHDDSYYNYNYRQYKMVKVLTLSTLKIFTTNTTTTKKFINTSKKPTQISNYTTQEKAN